MNFKVSKIIFLLGFACLGVQATEESSVAASGVADPAVVLHDSADNETNWESLKAAYDAFSESIQGNKAGARLTLLVKLNKDHKSQRFYAADVIEFIRRGRLNDLKRILQKKEEACNEELMNCLLMHWIHAAPTFNPLFDDYANEDGVVAEDDKPKFDCDSQWEVIKCLLENGACINKFGCFLIDYAVDVVNAALHDCLEEDSDYYKHKIQILISLGAPFMSEDRMMSYNPCDPKGMKQLAIAEWLLGIKSACLSIDIGDGLGDLSGDFDGAASGGGGVDCSEADVIGADAAASGPAGLGFSEYYAAYCNDASGAGVAASGDGFEQGTRIRIDLTTYSATLVSASAFVGGCDAAASGSVDGSGKGEGVQEIYILPSKGLTVDTSTNIADINGELISANDYYNMINEGKLDGVKMVLAQNPHLGSAKMNEGGVVESFLAKWFNSDWIIGDDEYFDHLNIIQLLVEQGADINEILEEGDSLLCCAIRLQEEDFFQEKDEELVVSDEDKSATILNKIKILLECGASCFLDGQQRKYTPDSGQNLDDLARELCDKRDRVSNS